VHTPSGVFTGIETIMCHHYARSEKPDFANSINTDSVG
jgi:hypothetical protein